jgi:glycosyltransferase involved in cell wall biosynthesis
MKATPPERITVPATAPDDDAESPKDERPAPVVSIGVPVYNAEKYLRVALDSMVAQTFRDIEIVISDNGSTDGTLEICREYQARDPRIRYVHNDVNRGLVWNHLRVQDLARGKYFMFGPQDDWIAPEYVERCVATLEADPGIAYVYSEALVMDEDGTMIGREITRQRVDSSPSTRFWDVLVVKGGVNFYGMTRLDLRRRIGRWKPLPRGERIVLAEMALWGRFKLLPGDLYFRRVHPNQFTTSRKNRRVESLQLDPNRSGGWRSTVPVILIEYVLAYASAVLRAPLSKTERVKGLARIARWVAGHVPGLRIRDPRAHKVEIVLAAPGAVLPEGRESVGY